MDLTNLPSRYTKVSTDEMQGDTAAASMVQGRGGRPTVIPATDVKDMVKPGFLTWDDGHPMFNVRGKVKITGQGVDLPKALEQKHVEKTQGQPAAEFVKPVDAKTLAGWRAYKKAQLGQIEESGAGGKLKCLLLSVAAGALGGWLVSKLT